VLAVAFPKSEALVLSPLPYTPDQALAGLVQTRSMGTASAGSMMTETVCALAPQPGHPSG